MKLLPRIHPRRADFILCAVIVIWGALRLLPGLAHPGMVRWDEDIHQAVTRGTYVEPLRPHVYRDHLYFHSPADWISGGTWLHKPPMPFWAGSMLLHVMGITPLALRLVSFLADLAVALALFFLMRASAGRLLSTVAAVAYLSLNFTWTLTQGFLFGDVTDTTLAACLTLATLAVVRAVQLSSLRWAILAGVFTGMGYLCKSFLALTPAAVAAVFFILQVRRTARGLSLPKFAGLLGTTVLVAAPWAIYSSQAWPAQYHANAHLVFAHLVEEIVPFGRSIDGLFNEINDVELFPIPVAFTLLAGAWIAWRAYRFRLSVDIALAVWIWASWIVLSLTPSKVPAHGFGVVPAILAAMVILLADCRRRPVLAATALAAMLSRVGAQFLPSLSRVRELVPSSLSQTRERPGLAEGLLLMGIAAFGFWALLDRRSSRPTFRGALSPSLGWASILGGVFLLAVATPLARHADEQRQISTVGATSYTREAGLALRLALPESSVLFIHTDRNPECCSEQHSLMFYSGMMAYRRAPDAANAIARGYKPFLVSPLAEPFAPVPSVPANAWWRAYDLTVPLALPAPQPQGLTPIAGRAGRMELLGVARGPAVTARDRWAFVARWASPEGTASEILVFKTRTGSERIALDLDGTLLGAEALKAAAWFVVPLLGPVRSEVIGLGLEDGTQLPLPPDL